MLSALDNTMAPTSVFAVLAVALLAGVNAQKPHKIANGSPAALGELPYQVSVRIWGRHFCSGAIVSSRHIVTAAHCVTGHDVLPTVVTGTISTSDGQVHTPTKIQLHDKFFEAEYSPYDIAIITLANEIVFNEVQNKIALPTARTPVGTVVTSSGWGYVNASITTVIPSLEKLKFKTISRERCQKMFGPKIQTYRHQICTYSSFGGCAGDSGSPLVVNGELIGVLSWGVPCSVGLPDVFSSVHHLLPWVNSIINK